MVEFLTSRPSVTLLSNLPSSLEDRQLEEASLRFKIASFSHATSGAHWNKRNLERRLRHFNDRLAIMICELRGTQIRIGRCEFMEVSEFLEHVSNSKARFIILFWRSGKPGISNLKLPKNVLLSSYVLADGVIIYAMLAELISLSWGTLSLRENPVRLGAIVDIAERLLDLGVEASDIKLEKIVGERPSEVAWTERAIFSDRVDFEKFIHGSRAEQKSDTLTRMLDAEATNISYHSSSNHRRTRVQALFWLMEVGEEFEPGILRSTSTFRFLSNGEDLIVEAARKTVRPRTSPDRKRLREFVDAFVDVPSGEYSIGENSIEKLSEPPASPRLVSVPSFRILNRPVTYSDWLLFCEAAPSWSRINDDLLLPVVSMNIAEAMLFAEYVTQTLTEESLLPCGSSVEIPPEEFWEIAARGHESRQYPWGNEFDQALCNADQVLGRTSRAFACSPGGDSIFGCSDMAGNVREWTSSKVPPSSSWGDEVIGEKIDLAHVSASDRYVVRGGSYSYDRECVRSWVRNTQVAARPGYDPQTGFRLVICR
ncbi:formylglycine-generating enzyme family protein [Dinoroseobacter sp. S124A]|uniref:formylglycine-generating enzyme family protein n=1 Tax=Dinoroseobacter sp. S124A TaxID=3415128 RepID=UPI003C7DA60E